MAGDPKKLIKNLLEAGEFEAPDSTVNQIAQEWGNDYKGLVKSLLEAGEFEYGDQEVNALLSDFGLAGSPTPYAPNAVPVDLTFGLAPGLVTPLGSQTKPPKQDPKKGPVVPPGVATTGPTINWGASTVTNINPVTGKQEPPKNKKTEVQTTAVAEPPKAEIPPGAAATGQVIDWDAATVTGPTTGPTTGGPTIGLPRQTGEEIFADPLRLAEANDIKIKEAERIKKQIGEDRFNIYRDPSFKQVNKTIVTPEKGIYVKPDPFAPIESEEDLVTWSLNNELKPIEGSERDIENKALLDQFEKSNNDILEGTSQNIGLFLNDPEWRPKYEDLVGRANDISDKAEALHEKIKQKGGGVSPLNTEGLGESIKELRLSKDKQDEIRERLGAKREEIKAFKEEAQSRAANFTTQEDLDAYKANVEAIFKKLIDEESLLVDEINAIYEQVKPHIEKVDSYERKSKEEASKFSNDPDVKLFNSYVSDLKKLYDEIDVYRSAPDFPKFAKTYEEAYKNKDVRKNLFKSEAEAKKEADALRLYVEKLQKIRDFDKKYKGRSEFDDVLDDVVNFLRPAGLPVGKLSSFKRTLQSAAIESFVKPILGGLAWVSDSVTDNPYPSRYLRYGDNFSVQKMSEIQTGIEGVIPSKYQGDFIEKNFVIKKGDPLTSIFPEGTVVLTRGEKNDIIGFRDKDGYKVESLLDSSTVETIKNHINNNKDKVESDAGFFRGVLKTVPSALDFAILMAGAPGLARGLMASPLKLSRGAASAASTFGITMAQQIGRSHEAYLKQGNDTGKAALFAFGETAAIAAVETFVSPIESKLISRGLGAEDLAKFRKIKDTTIADIATGRIGVMDALGNLWRFLKEFSKTIGVENFEEFIQKDIEDVFRYVASGEEIDTTIEDRLNTVFSTSLITFLPAISSGVTSYQRAKADLITTSLWNATKNRESFEKDLNQSVEAKQVQEISAEYYKSVVKYVDEELQSYDNLTKEQEVGLSGLIATRFNLELKSSQVENQNARKRYKEKIEEINKRIEDVVGNKTPVEVAPEVQDMVSDAEVVASPEDLANVQVDSQESLTQLEQDQARLQTLQSAISENNNAIANGIDPILTQEQAAEYENEITILNQKIKDQQDAIQEQSTAAISVQPEPQTGEGVGGQVQAKPEVTAREGEVETEVEVAKEEVTGLVQDEAFDNSSDTKSFVGSFVDYQGVRGVLLEDGQGNIIVDTGQGDVLVEGALSDMTNKDLGLSRAERAEIKDEDVEKIEQDVAANIDPTVIQTDFGTGRIFYGNREFKYESSNLDKDGNTISIDVTDANGKRKTIRNKQAVEEIELQKMIFEDLLNNNKITLDNEFAKQFQAQATDLGIKPTVTAPQRGQGRTEPVQQGRPAEGAEGTQAEPEVVKRTPGEIKGFEVKKKDGTTVPASNYVKDPKTGKWERIDEKGKSTPVNTQQMIQQLEAEEKRLVQEEQKAIKEQEAKARAAAGPVEIKGFEVKKKDGTTVPPSNYRKNPNTGKWVKVNDQGKATPVSSPAIVEQLNNEQARLQKGKTPAVTPQPVQAPTVTVKAPTIEVTPQPEAKEAGVEKTEQKAETKPETTTTKPAPEPEVAEPAPAKKTPEKPKKEEPKKEQPKKEEPATKAKSLSQEADDLFDSIFGIKEETDSAQERMSTKEGPIEKGDVVLPISAENQSAIDALSNFLNQSGITVEVVDSKTFKENSQKKNFSGNADGVFLVGEGKVLLNIDKIENQWGKTIIFHEGIHPVINIIRNTNAKLYDAIVQGIRLEAKKNKAVAAAVAQVESSEGYKSKGKDFIEDETVVEVLARVASGKIKLSEVRLTLKERMVNMLNKIADVLRLPQISLTSTDAQFKSFAAKLSAALQKGGKLSDIVGEENVTNFTHSLKTLDNPLFEPTPLSQNSEDINRSIYGPKIEHKGEKYSLSFVNPENLIDIEAFIKKAVEEGRNIWLWTADQLGRGIYSDETIEGDHYLDAGPSFALDPENLKEGIIWATGINEKTANERIKNSDYIFIISGSPQKSKLFNRQVTDLLRKRIEKASGLSWAEFSNKVIDLTTTKTKSGEIKKTDITRILERYNSLEDPFKALLNSEGTDRKELFINLEKQILTTDTPLAKYLKEIKVSLDVNSLRDGFYAENDFNINDILIVLKPESLSEKKSKHSTYQKDLLGKVIGVPDRRVNAIDLLPKERRDKFNRASPMTGAAGSMIITPQLSEGIQRDPAQNKAIEEGIKVGLDVKFDSNNSISINYKGDSLEDIENEYKDWLKENNLPNLQLEGIDSTDLSLEQANKLLDFQERFGTSDLPILYDDVSSESKINSTSERYNIDKGVLKKAKDLFEESGKIKGPMIEPQLSVGIKRKDLLATADRVKELPKNKIDELKEIITGRIVPPTKKKKVYKLFKVKVSQPGQLFPLFVGAKTPILTGTWLEATPGAFKVNEKGKIEVESSLGALAYRPGWHSGDIPVATHIGKKANPANRKEKPSIRYEYQIWAEVEVGDDFDWQTEANNRASYDKKGNMVANTAHITDQVPFRGNYKYKTNANMTGSWVISGEMKVVKVLTDEEVAKLNEEDGIYDLPRTEPFDYERYGFTKDMKPVNEDQVTAIQITESYYKAKQDNSNPELVNAVEDLIGVSTVQASVGITRGTFDARNPGPKGEQAFIKDKNALIEGIKKKIADAAQNKPYKEIDFIKDMAIRGITITPEDATLLFKRATVPSTLPRTSQRILETASIPENIKDAIVEQTKPKQSVTDEDLEALADSVLEEATMAETDKEAVEIYEQTVNDIIDQLGPKFSRMLLGEVQLIYELRVLKKIAEALKNMGNMQGATDVLQIITNFGSISGRALREMGLNFSADAIYIETLSRNSDPNNEIILNNRVSATSNKTNREAIEEISQATSQSMQENAAEIAANAAARAAKAKAKMDEKKAEEKTTTPTTTEKLREAAKAINQKATEKLNLFNDIMKQLRGLKLAYDPKQEASLLADASKAFLMYAYYKTSGSIIRARIMFLEMADLKKAHKDVDKYIAELSKDEFPAATREIAKAKILEALQEDEKQQTKTPTPAQLIARRIKAFDRKNQRVKPTPKTLEQRINDLDLDITILTELRDSIEAELLPLPEDKRAEMMSKVEDLLFELKSEKLKKRAAPWITKTQIRKDFKEGLKSLEETITDLITDWSKIDVYTKNIGEEFIKRTGMTAEEAKPFINIIEQEINKIVDTKIKSDIEKQIRESYSGNRDELTDRIKSKESEIEYLTGLIENLEAKDKTTEEVAILKERKKRLGQAKKELNNLKGALKKFDDISERAMKSGDFRRMLAAIKTNGLNSDTVLQEFAYTLGLDVLNRDDLDRINFMTQKIKNAMTAADEIAATKELEKFVYSISNISALEQFHRIYESFLYGNMLSSPRTAEVAFFSGMFGLFRDFVGNFGVAIFKDILNVAPITYRDGFKVKGVEVIPKNTLLVLSAVLDTFGTNKVFDFRTLVDVLKGAEGITIQQSDIDKKGQDRLFASLNEIEKADALIKRIKENKNWTKRPQDLSKVSALEAFKFQQRMARLLVVGDYMARSAAIPYATRMITAEMAMESLPVGSSFLSIYKKSSALINRARAKELAEIRAAQMADAGLGFDKKRYERKIAVEALPEEVQQQIKDYADRLAWTGRIMGKSGQYSKATNNLYTKGLGEPFGVSGGKRVRDEGTLVSIGKLAWMMFVTTVKMLTIPFPGVQFRGAQMIKNSLPLAGIIQKRMILDENGNYIPKGGFQLFSEYREYSSAGKVIDVVKATKWDFWNRAAASALPVIFSSFLFQAMFTFKFDDEEEDKKYNELGALDPRQLMMIYDQASEGKVSVDLDSREDWFITGDYDNDVKAVLESKGTQYEPFAIYKKDERGVFKKIPFLGSYKDAPYGVYLNGMAAVFERNLLAKQVKGSGKATRDPLTPGELFAIMSFGSVSFLGEFGLNGVSDNIKIVTALFEDNPEALSKVDYTFKRLQQNAVRQNTPQSAFASFWANIRGMYTGEGKRKGLDVVDGALANTYVMGDLVDTYDYDALGRRIPYQESPYPLLAGLERGIASVNNSAYSILNSTVFEQTITNADRIRTKEVDFAALIRKMSTQDVLKTEMTVVAMGDEEVRYFMGLEAANNKFQMLEDYYEYLDSLDRSDLSKRLRAVNTKGNEHAFCNYVLGVLETKAEEFNFKTDITVNDLRELISTIPEDGIGLTSKHEATKKGVLKYNEDGTPVLKPAYYKKSKLIDFLYKNNIHIKADGSIDFTKNYSAIYNDDVHEEYMLNSLMEEIFEEDME
jgi:hypothetical protein